MSTLTMDQAVKQYVIMRNEKERIDAEAKLAIAELRENMDTIESWIIIAADNAGVSSFKTEHGTAIVKDDVSVRVSEWDKTLDFIKEGDHYEMLERRISKLAVKDYIKEFNEIPPGLNYETFKSVSVRKPTKKA